MLTKLMKHELRATSRLLIPLYVVLLFLSIINRFLLNTSYDNEILEIIRGFLVSIYTFSIFVILAATVIYMIIRFYRNLLTDEGYLMFTLPVKKHELIISKLLIAVFWSIISIASIIISLFIVFATKGTLPDAINIIKEAIINLTREFGVSWIIASTELFIITFLSLVLNILLVYLSISVGQLFSKHKIIGSFVSYAAIYTIIQFLLMITLVVFGNMENGVFTNPKTIFPIAIVVLAIGCAAFYSGINYIFTRKLNLD